MVQMDDSFLFSLIYYFTLSNLFCLIFFFQLPLELVELLG